MSEVPVRGTSAPPGAAGGSAGRYAVAAELMALFDKDPSWIPGEAAAMTEAIHGELTALSDEADIRDLTYRSSEAVLRMAAQLLPTSIDVRDAEPPPAAVEYARALVRRGVAVETLLRAYQVGSAAWFERWAARVRVSERDADRLSAALEQGASWSHAYVTALSGGLVERYSEERERWMRSAEALRAGTVKSLLIEDAIDPVTAEARLGYALAGQHIGFVVWARDHDDADITRLDRAALELAGSFASARPLLHPLDSHSLAGWVNVTDGHRPDVAACGRTRSVMAAVGNAHEGIGGFALTHREAMHAKRVAELSPVAPPSVTSYRTVALVSLASMDIDQARTFVQAELGPLGSDDEAWSRLANTLEVYLRNNSRVRPTAQQLSVHENTVKNRIKAVTDALGEPVEPRAASLLVALELAPLIRTAGGRAPSQS